MPTSQNGWSASPTLARRPLIVNGVEFIGGIRDDDAVEAVLGYVLKRIDDEVEPLINPGCWGFSYRANANNPNSLSNHASGTAVDFNAPQHPNGVPTARTFTTAQVARIHNILADVDHVIRWGGDYSGTPDAMHLEVVVDQPTLAAVAARLEEDQDVSPEQEDRIVKRVIDGLLAAQVGGKTDPATLKQAVNQIRTAVKKPAK